MKSPYGMAELLKLRQSGKRPGDHVVLFTAGPQRCDHYTVWLNGDDAGNYDWSPLVGLDVEIATSFSYPIDKLAQLVQLLSPIVDGIFVTWDKVPVMLTAQWVKGCITLGAIWYTSADVTAEQKDMAVKLQSKLAKLCQL